MLANTDSFHLDDVLSLKLNRLGLFTPLIPSSSVLLAIAESNVRAFIIVVSFLCGESDVYQAPGGPLRGQWGVQECKVSCQPALFRWVHEPHDNFGIHRWRKLERLQLDGIGIPAG